jgi:dUTPase
MSSTSCADSDHVVMLQKVDKMILVAEESQYDIGFRRRLQAFRNLLVIHAAKTKDLGEAAQQLIKNHRRRILAIGIPITLSIGIPYFLLTKTSWLLPKSLLCQVFPTINKQYSGTIEVCVNGVSHPYRPENGDVELDITFVKNNNERIQSDVTFWVADEIADKRVDYSGEYNIDRIRTYNSNGILVDDRENQISSWIQPLVPEDVRMPMWRWIYDNRDRFYVERKPLEEKVTNFFNSLGALFATIGSAGITIYRFMKAGI